MSEFDVAPMFPEEGIRAYDPRRDTAFAFKPTPEFFSDLKSLWETLRGAAEVGGTVLPLLGIMPGAPNPKGLPLTKVMTGGKPTRVYHGTPKVFQDLDPAKSKGGMYGPSPGGYWTENPKTAVGYAEGPAHLKATEDDVRVAQTVIPQWREQARVWGEEFKKTGNLEALRKQRSAQGQVDRLRYTLQNLSQPNIRPAYLDITNPLDLETSPPPQWVNALKTWYQKTYPQNNGEVLRWLEDSKKLGTGVDLYRGLTKSVGFPLEIVRKTIQDAGFDGITHIGQSGARQWIPFRKDQIIPAFEYEAGQYKSRLERLQHRD